MNATLSATTKLGSRRVVHILNPASGKPGYFDSARRAIEKEGGEIQVSQHMGGITELVRDHFKSDPFAHAVIYGGDGSVNEAVNGIMLSGATDTASFSVYPMGSGNDFSATLMIREIFQRQISPALTLSRLPLTESCVTAPTWLTWDLTATLCGKHIL